MVAGRLHKTIVCVRMPTLLWSTLALKSNLTWCLCFIVIDSMSLWVIVVIDNQLFQLILHRHGKVHRPAVPRARPEADQVLPWQGVHDSTSLELAQFWGLLVWHEMFLSNCLALSCCCFASNVCFGLQECPGIEVNVPIGGRNYVAIPSLNADQPTQYQISHGLRGIAQEECFCSLLYAVFVLWFKSSDFANKQIIDQTTVRSNV